MNSENFHPVLTEPPAAHALHKWDDSEKILSYEYNGTDIIQVCFLDAGDVGFRHGSDGSMRSICYVQQIYITTDRPLTAKIRIMLTSGAVSMRPNRARSGQAIFGQIGKPLISSANGLYDLNWDLLIDWRGAAWSWVSDRIILENDSGVAEMMVELSEKPFYINIRPLYYKRHLGYKYHSPWLWKPEQRPIAGWCSWEAYRRGIDEQKIRHIAEFLAAELSDYGLRYVQIDDGFQKMPLPYKPECTMTEGWLRCEETKFPNGHESIVAAVKDFGMIPGIWVNANITNPEFVRHHPDSVIWHKGEALKGEWIDYLYNCLPETLEKHVEPLFRALAELGYEYVKIDAIRHLIFDGLHECVRLGMLTNDEAESRFRAFMASTRKGLGDKPFYLASWGEMGEVVGLADSCRIAMDANPTWAGVRMQLFESARWFFTQRILFLNDPDHVCVRTDPEWAKTVLSIISLTGQLYMLSDAPEMYTPEKLEILRKTLPPLETRTAETGPLDVEFPAYTWTKLHGFAVQSNEAPVSAEDVCIKDALDMAGIFPTMDDAHPFSSLWAFHIDNADRKWCVAARAATMPLAACKVPLDSLGLDIDKVYCAFDFWTQEYIGEVFESIECKTLKIGHCQIIALHERVDRPFVVASSRHVSMDAVSIKRHCFADNVLLLELYGSIGSNVDYWVYCPGDYSIIDCDSVGGTAGYRYDGRVYILSVAFGKAEVSIKLAFNRNR